MKKDIFDLSGRIAVVSGASRGIGESTAKLLAAYGAQVICSSRKLDGVQAVAGAIINTASINGVKPGTFQGIYSVTKAAIINMTLAFAKECAPHRMRVNAVLPGLTDTKFASALTKNEQMLKTFLPMIPLHRMAQ